MNTKAVLDELYSREMSRYDFLKYIGVMLLSLIGVVGLLRTIAHLNGPKPDTISTLNYGSSSYGGTAQKPASSILSFSQHL